MKMKKMKAQTQQTQQTQQTPTPDWRQLLWSEFPNVKSCTKRVLEDITAFTHARELSYAAALQRVMDLYDSERTYRAAQRDPLALALDALGAVPPFRCAVSAALFSANCDIASLLVSHDPLVKATEEFLRTTVEERARSDRVTCTFDVVLNAFLDFAHVHRTSLHAGSETTTTRFPLGMQPLCARVNGGGSAYMFPSAAAWAAFVANKSLWQRLTGAPSQSMLPLPLPLTLPLPLGSNSNVSTEPAKTEKTEATEETEGTWQQASCKKKEPSQSMASLPVFVLAPDVHQAWKRQLAKKDGHGNKWQNSC
jgi:hypothetical protein